MTKKQKVLLTLGSLAVAATPFVTVISCGDTSKNNPSTTEKPAEPNPQPAEGEIKTSVQGKKLTLEIKGLEAGAKVLVTVKKPGLAKDTITSKEGTAIEGKVEVEFEGVEVDVLYNLFEIKVNDQVKYNTAQLANVPGGALTFKDQPADQNGANSGSNASADSGNNSAADSSASNNNATA